ncbi:hypothetical protein F4810DRAFT_476307 [Camillea tinctor]|nr:hypothetical protein F4810DRAFT_476307 [Camillea tinctor]
MSVKPPHVQSDASGTASMSLSYTLPLNDGALGTIPLTHQQTALALLKADAPRLTAAVRPLLSAFVAKTARRIQELGWCKASRRLALYFAISALELQLLICAPALFLAVPGLIFLPCVGLEVVLLWFLVQRLNQNHNQHETFTYTGAEGTPAASAAKNNTSTTAGSSSWYWIVVGGIDLDPEATREVTLPRLAALFASDMHAFTPSRLGLPLDIAAALILPIITTTFLCPTTSRSAALYKVVRAQLLRNRKKPVNSDGGVRILAHNTGAADVAWVLARLCADLPAAEGLLDRLQVFTFGAAAVEMTIPLGGQQRQQDDGDGGAGGGYGGYYPTVTHYAFEDDPVAQMGVLRGVCKRLEGRFVGNLYTIRNNHKPSGSYRFQSRFLPIRAPSYTLDDYLDALFPDGDPRAGVLGRVCRIDHETSEMRELAALAQSVSNNNSDPGHGTSRADAVATKRLSWTVLGAVAGGLSSSNGGDQGADMAGAFSLNEVRRRGKALEGMRGYENNALADAAMSSLFQWEQTRTGMLSDGDGDEDGDKNGTPL